MSFDKALSVKLDRQHELTLRIQPLITTSLRKKLLSTLLRTGRSTKDTIRWRSSSSLAFPH